jgi:PAS domain S-box-containing protein
MSLRWQLLWPPALCAVALVALLGVSGAAAGAALALAAGGLLVLLAAAALAIERHAIRPLARLREAAREGRPVIHRVAGEIAALDREIQVLHGLVERKKAELAKAREQGRRAHTTLQHSEERFLLAVRGAKDGLWEWDLQSGAVHFSPRWKAMLGFAEEEFPNRKEAWLAHMHPDDAAAVEAALRQHVDGASSHFERQLRMRHKDGHYRWLLSRGAALRHASGKPYRMVGLDTVFTREKRVENIVELIAEGTAGAHGEIFFRALVRHFAAALVVACAFVTECVDHPTTRVRTLAYWKAQDFRDNIEFELAGTPCEAVVQGGKTCFLPSGVGRSFPRDAAYESYIGVPIFGSDDAVIGHLAFFDTRAMTEEVLVEPIFRIFCARAGAELERRNALERLARHLSPAA